MAKSSDEPAWKSIARRKFADQQKALYQPPSISIKVPPSLLPKDPPQAEDGPQPVYQIPQAVLTTQDNLITSLPLPTLLSQIHSGTLTSTAVTEAYIRRASVTHQLTNCLTEILFTRALDHASRLDKHFNSHPSTSSNRLVGPLHGLPVSVKDGFNIKGFDSSIGLTALCYKPATSNAPLVELLESLGCIIIAKTNIPQTLASLDSINYIFGRTYNPFNRLLTAGGSSGGEGVLVSMRGSAIGFGTDIGGSIRIPAMCNGIYGFKPSESRVPYGGQASTSLPGMPRAGVQAVAGPIARSSEDIALVMREITRVSSLFGGDCLPLDRPWSGSSTSLLKSAGVGSSNKPLTIGVLRSDGNCTLLPPITSILNEIKASITSLSHTQNLNITLVEIPTPRAWTRSQSLMSKLMSIDSSADLSKLLLSTSEPLVPWMSTRFKHNGKHVALSRVAELQAERSRLEAEMIRDIWCYTSDPTTDTFNRRTRTIDAIICPVAAHPTPEIERWNAVGYTSSWVLFDYPAGVVPVRELTEDDLELGRNSIAESKSLGSWDERCRELWDEGKTDRRVYTGSMLSVQVVTGRLEDEKLVGMMGLVERAVGEGRKIGGKGMGKGVDEGGVGEWGRQSKL